MEYDGTSRGTMVQYVSLEHQNFCLLVSKYEKNYELCNNIQRHIGKAHIFENSSSI